MKFGARDALFLVVLVGGIGLAARVVGLWPPPARESATVRTLAAVSLSRDPIIDRVDREFRRIWDETDLTPVPRASKDRLAAWLDDLLRDRRCADYLAERFARVFVGVEDGPFIVFRRRRFTTWLSDAIAANRPYDSIVRDLVADSGLWTDHPATNFVSVTFDPTTGLPDPERLAARVTRAFLGVRLDCAQCHDHPFQPWRQTDFRGLAAFFGNVHANLRGIRDGAATYRPLARKSKEPTDVEPQVPFHPELLPASGPPRARLAAWLVDTNNPGFARVTVNRVWALLFGRSLTQPIDDLPDSEDLHPVLDLLARDFAGHGYNLRRLIQRIAATEVFGLDSAAAEAGVSPTEHQETAWSVFPLTRLRPEQLAGSLFQVGSLTTIGPQSPWFVRLTAFDGRNKFVRRYGDADEFEEHPGTIPQQLVLMNGDLVGAKTKLDITNAATRIALLAPDDRKAVETAYLAVLTRRPTIEESTHFESRLARSTGKIRQERLSDLYWTLLNTTEFSWNH
jgi:hypothetical protein